MTTFETASIGERVWYVLLGWGTIINVFHEEDYPIAVEFEFGDIETFTKAGREYSDTSNQTLFWDEVKFEVPTKPLPKLNKDDCVEVWNANTVDPTITYKRHFSHFEDGSIFCFGDGGTSWTRTQTNGWNRWRKPK